MEKLNYKIKNIERKYFKDMQKTISKGKEDFIELQERELKEWEVKITREIEELLFKPIIVSIDDMNKFEEKEI